MDTCKPRNFGSSSVECVCIYIYICIKQQKNCGEVDIQKLILYMELCKYINDFLKQKVEFFIKLVTFFVYNNLIGQTYI